MDVVGESFGATTKRAEVRTGKVSVCEGFNENLTSQPMWEEVTVELRQFRWVYEGLGLLAVAWCCRE